MNKAFRYANLLFLIIPVLLCCVSCSHTRAAAPLVPQAPPPAPEVRTDPRVFIEDMLVSKGHKRMAVRAMLGDPRVAVSPGVMLTNMFYSAPAASAKNPKVMDVSPRYIGKGMAFIDEYADAYDEAWERYAVGPEVITAILIIETNLGKYPMKYRVFNVYASLTTLMDSEYLDSVLRERKDRHTLTEEIAKSARKKGNWGLGELSALITLSNNLGIDPLEVKGSFAGALGPAQFIPTSFVKFGVDGNGDKRIDPFDMEDCIVSIANYLKLSGWKEDAELERRRRAVFSYNHHEVYVNTIMMLCDQLQAAGEQGLEEEEPAEQGAADGNSAGTGTNGPSSPGGNGPVKPSDQAVQKKE